MGQSVTIVKSPERYRVVSTASSAVVAVPLAVVAMLLCCWMLNFAPQDLQAADLEVKPFGAKVLEFVQSPDNPDIIILGSSLALTPSVRSDEAFHGQRHRYDQWYYDHVINHYTRADYLQHLLSRGHAPVSLTNLALSSSMMSDYVRIVNIFLQANKRPKLVICCIAPRDLVDNTCAKETDTWVSKALDSLFVSKVPTAQPLAQHPAVRLVRTFRHLLKLRLAATFENGPLWKWLKCHTGFLQILGLDNIGQLNNVPSYARRPNTLKGLELYQKIYQPPNHSLMVRQAANLDLMAQLLEAKQIKLVLVAMPLPKANLALIDKTLYREYNNQLLAFSKSDRGVLNLTSGDFSQGDFEDACHLNEQGGIKLDQAIAGFIANRDGLSQPLYRGR